MPSPISVVSKSERILFVTKTVFPFTFFPDKLIIDETKVIVIYGIFFMSQSSFPMLISDLRNVVLTTNIFFSSLSFELAGLEQNPRIISYLPKEDATMAQKLITGLMVLQKEKANLQGLSEKEVIEYSLKAGETFVSQ
jgi:hypothetical protein